MSHLLNKLADLTAERDRTALDRTLVSTVNDLIKPLTLVLYRLVGEEGQQRWLTCAQLGPGTGQTFFQPAWVEFESLPPLDAYPLRVQATTGARLVQSQDQRLSIFGLGTGPDGLCVLEMTCAQPLSKVQKGQVAAVLRLFGNFEQALDYGERDALTELLNRKTFDGAFMKATLERQTDPQSLPDDRRDPAADTHYWLAMLDIDHFKRVNDNFGHLIGDEVLLLLARLMRSNFRFQDQLYRFGGEEFVVLMRCHSEAESADALERLRAATERFNFPQVGCITISIGFTEVRSGDTPSGAFERADKAVYYAKEHGRNQVCSYAHLIASGVQEKVVNAGDMELF